MKLNVKPLSYVLLPGSATRGCPSPALAASRQDAS